MPLRIAIVGPGRVGCAFARQFVRAGANVLGLIGRDRERTRNRLGELGLDPQRGLLDWRDLALAHVVVFAVSDDELREAVRAASAVGGRRCSLWLHTSGRHDLEVFDEVRQLGVRTGSLHPLLPFSASLAEHAMQGAPALLLAEPRSMRLLRRLCDMLELQPIECAGHDRVLYHVACALAANGVTALFALASELLQAAGGVAKHDGDRIVAALMQAAVLGSKQHGAAAALSGPVRRGDAATVSAHLVKLRAQAPTALPAYLALMQRALELAREQGLPVDSSERVAAVLSRPMPSS